MSSEDPSRKGRPTDVAKYEAIVAAAGQQFFDRGFAAASIERLLARMGNIRLSEAHHGPAGVTDFTRIGRQHA